MKNEKELVEIIYIIFISKYMRVYRAMYVQWCNVHILKFCAYTIFTKNNSKRNERENNIKERILKTIYKYICTISNTIRQNISIYYIIAGGISTSGTGRIDYIHICYKNDSSVISRNKIKGVICSCRETDFKWN